MFNHSKGKNHKAMARLVDQSLTSTKQMIGTANTNTLKSIFVKTRTDRMPNQMVVAKHERFEVYNRK